MLLGNIFSVAFYKRNCDVFERKRLKSGSNFLRGVLMKATGNVESALSGDLQHGIKRNVAKSF